MASSSSASHQRRPSSRSSSTRPTSSLVPGREDRPLSRTSVRSHGSEYSAPPVPAPAPKAPSAPAPREPLLDSTNAVPVARGSKADQLRAWKKSQRMNPLPPSEIHRDALYLLQGINGKYIRFKEVVRQVNPYLRVPGEEEEVAGGLEFIESPEGIISPPQRQLLSSLAEVGWLYRNVETFVASINVPHSSSLKGKGKETGREWGLTEQSLAHHLSIHLQAYHHHLSTLETILHSPSTSTTTGSAAQVFDESGLSLKRLLCWIDSEEMNIRLKMRVMSLLVDSCAHVSGGALISQIYSLTENGSTFIQSFLTGVLNDVSKPFFNTLSSFLHTGALVDPHAEFFVKVNDRFKDLPIVGRGGEGGGLEDGFREFGLGGVESWELWEKKYEFKKEMLPTFVSEEFGRKIFSAGKSLNFIRHSCGDNDWILTQSANLKSTRVLQYSDVPGLERSIDSTYKLASERLLEVFVHKFNLMVHLKALKDYLILGHGDFVDLLMENLGPSLSRPANTLYRHTLTATLETAVRGSSASLDPPDVRRRLDARMLEYNHGEIGWDSFMLDYKVDAPIDTILDPTAIEGYQKLFYHLWRLKRIESALGANWLSMASSARSSVRSKAMMAQWHTARVLQTQMEHFIRNLQAFYQLEVIECSWQALNAHVEKKQGDLDGIISAHQEYLARLSNRILLNRTKTNRSKDSILIILQEIFQLILDFKLETEKLYNLTAATYAKEVSRRDAELGVYTGRDSLPRFTQVNATDLSRVNTRIMDIRRDFYQKVKYILGGAQGSKDPEIQLLATRLDYNGYYRNPRNNPDGAASSEARPRERERPSSRAR